MGRGGLAARDIRTSRNLEAIIVGNGASSHIDPTIRGLVCCLMDLELEAVSLGQELAASLIAAAYLARAQPDSRSTSGCLAANDWGAAALETALHA